MKLLDCDIKTREVLGWQGVHLFHAASSSCSQKVRIYLNLKGIAWTSHLVDLMGKANLTDYYMGINPRGLVPVLVHDGAVHVESNDILTHLEAQFPEPQLIPADHRQSVDALLRHEDDLHLALRTLSFRFMFPSSGKPPKSPEDLVTYQKGGSGTVGGVADPAKAAEIAFWSDVIDRGITDQAARDAAAVFRTAFEDLDRRLADTPYILGQAMSVLDIAWLVYINRLRLAGYPVAKLHPALSRWADELCEHPAFKPEITLAPPMLDAVAANQAALAQRGQTLANVCGL